MTRVQFPVAEAFLTLAMSSNMLVAFANTSRRGASIAQLGERQTEDLEVPGSIPGLGILIFPTVVHAR